MWPYLHVCVYSSQLCMHTMLCPVWVRVCVHVRAFVHVNVRNGEWNLKMREEERCFLLVLLFSSFCLSADQRHKKQHVEQILNDELICSSTQLKCPLQAPVSCLYLSRQSAVFIKQDFGLLTGINQQAARNLLLDGSVTTNMAAISWFILLSHSLQLNYVTSLISVNVPESCI